MKKLVSVLLMLALLGASAVAMAAEKFPFQLTGSETIEYDLSRSRGSSGKKLSGEDVNGKYTAKYSFFGALKSYTYKYKACNCEVDYTPFGGLMDSPIRRNLPGGIHLEWDREAGVWVGGMCPDDHTPVGHIENPPVYFINEVKVCPPENAMELVPSSLGYTSYAALKNAALTTFAEKRQELDGAELLHTYERKNSNGEVQFTLYLYKKNGMYGLYNNDDFVETFVGNLVFNKGNEQCWLGGVGEYGVNTEGFYNWEDGTLEYYKFYTADRSVNAVYSLKNVLLSYETWDDKGGWWGFFDNTWYYAENGDPNDEENTVKKNPPAEILEKILHAPAPAEYESACVTSESQLKEDQKGVPFILADKSAINNATVQTVAEQTGERSTEFDITLMNGNEEVDLAKPVTLTLGYPAGMPQSVSKNYEFAVVHTLDDGTEEVMTTMTDNVKLTANGPQVTATGFSPYTVIWGTKAELAEYAEKAADSNSGVVDGKVEALPQTGDDSMLLLWVALLTVSTTVLVVKKRSRA